MNDSPFARLLVGSHVRPLYLAVSYLMLLLISLTALSRMLL